MIYVKFIEKIVLNYLDKANILFAFFLMVMIYYLYYNYGGNFMSSFALKIVACLTMICDHFGYLIYNGKLSFLNFIGRIAFPIFAFQISEGYSHTKNLKKYISRLLIFAIISQIPFMLFHDLISSGFALNIFFTLLLGLICIILYDKLPYKSLSIIMSVCIAYIAQINNCDYGFYGVAIILLFYVYRNNRILMSLTFCFCTIIKYWFFIIKYSHFTTYSFLCLFTIIPIIFINLYNKKQGKKIKYFLYIFYPAHLLIIYFLWNIIYI